MAVHTLQRTTILHTTVEQAWDFFSSPGNLSRITPPELGLRVTGEVPGRIYAGMMISYRVRPLPGITMTWLTEITGVEEGAFFVDEQRVGPYRIWHHEHHFRRLDEGRVEMRDIVTYVLPFGWLGNLAHPLLVASRLERIFAYREEVIRSMFPAPGQPHSSR